jgi:hypothetical protein
MNKQLLVAASIAAATAFTSPAFASSPDSWAELMKRASESCVKASELKNARTGVPVDFSDKVLVIIDGTWPQPHMKDAPARFACLYDKSSLTAEAHEAPL